MPRGGGQSGQATIEWAGLVVCLALIFGALLAGGRSAAKGEAGRGLGEAVAERITCAVRGACDSARPPVRRPAFHRERRRGAPGGRSGLRNAAGVLGGGSRLLKRTWFACLAYRSWQDDREHPRLLGEARPVKRTAHMLNECVNPLSFLFGE
jgi:hypothetical protein